MKKPDMTGLPQLTTFMTAREKFWQKVCLGFGVLWLISTVVMFKCSEGTDKLADPIWTVYLWGALTAVGLVFVVMAFLSIKPTFPEKN